MPLASSSTSTGAYPDESNMHPTPCNRTDGYNYIHPSYRNMVPNKYYNLCLSTEGADPFQKPHCNGTASWPLQKASPKNIPPQTKKSPSVPINISEIPKLPCYHHPTLRPLHWHYIHHSYNLWNSRFYHEANPRYKNKLWEYGLSNKWVCLLHLGLGLTYPLSDLVISTGNLFFIKKCQVPSGRKVTYANFVCNISPQNT